MAEENGDGAVGSSDGRGDRALAPDGGDVLGERGVDDEKLRARIEREGSTIDPAATEKSVETTDGDMDIGQGGPDDDDRERADRSTDEGIDLESALSDALDDEGDVLEQTASGTDHAVGEGDPDDLFEEFEEDSPEELIQAADEPDESEDEVDVSGLFEDLGEVEESTVSAPATETETAETADSAPAEGGEEILLGDTDETAGEIEGLLDDLTTVDVEEGDTSGTGTAHTEPTILSTEETAATGFQWLGEDIQIFPSDGDPDAVFDEFDEETPEELIETASDDGVTATALFDDLADGAVTHPDVDARSGGWSAGDAGRAGVEATALFDRMTAATDPPETAPADAASTDEGGDAGVTTFGDTETADADRGSAADTAGADAGTESDDGIDLDLDLETDTADPAETDTADTDTTDPAAADTGTTANDDGLDLDLDLETDTDATDTAESETEAGSVAIDLDSIDEAESDAETETADAGVVDAGAPVEETGSELDFDLDLDEPDATTNGASADPEQAPTPDTDSEPDTQPAPDGAVAAESDVDAVFERFDEGSPEELIAAADDESESTPVEGIEPSEEHIDDLFGDLSAVSLTPDEREETSQETGEALEPGSDETVAAIEGLLGDMSPADVPETMSEDDRSDDPTAGGAKEPTFAAEAEGEPDLGDGAEPDGLEQTSEDTHVAVGESDIDAFFERFNESSPEEIAESARVPPLEELSERDPERVREQIGDDHTERTPEVGDDDPVEVLGPDDGDDESLSGAIREDLGAGTEPGDGESRDRGRDQDGRDGGDGLSDLDPDDIFEDAGGRARGASGFGDRSATEPDTEPAADPTAAPETGSGSDADAESAGVTMNGEDLVSDARQADAGAESTDRTNSERVGEALTDDDAETDATDTAVSEQETETEPDSDSTTESEGIVARIVSRLRGLF